MREATKPAHLAGYVELPMIESSSPTVSLLCPFHLLSLVLQRHVQSLAIHARIGHWGSLKSPFYEMREKKSVDALFITK
jgi:hypothetical protein